MIYSLVQVDTEDETFQPHRVWGSTWSRLEKKALSLQERVQVEMRRKISRGEDPPDVTKRGRPLSPIAKIDESGHLEWDTTITDTIKALGKRPPR